MKRLNVSLLAIFAFLAFSASGVMFAGMKARKTNFKKTGTLIDSKCYFKAKLGMGMGEVNAHDTHMMPGNKKVPGCATACAAMGIPVGLKVGRKTYILATQAGSLSGYMAKKVTVVGWSNGSTVVPTAILHKGKKLKLGGM